MAPFRIVFAMVGLLGCGGRTDLDVSVTDLLTDGSLDASSDAHDDVKDDVIVTDAGCVRDQDCDDRVACTLDRCDPTLHVCTHALRDALCDDGIYCDGDERCDPTAGCVKGPVRDCTGPVACTDDSCDEAKKTCIHTPDDKKCPISHVCDPVLGCQAHAFAHDSTTLYDIRIPSGVVNTIGSTGSQLTDIALDPTNVLYGVGFDALYIVDQSTGNATLSKSISTSGLNGADSSPSGTLYVSGGSLLYTCDVSTGALTTVMSFPGGRTSSGDLAFIGTTLLATANGSGSDDLVQFDLSSKTASVLGSVGYSCIWGLAAYGTTLYGLTCEGRILSIDPKTGKGSQLNKVSTAFWGASAR